MAQFVFFVSLFKIKLINVRLLLSKWHLLTIYIRHWVIHRSLNPYNKWMKSVMLISSLGSWEIWGALRLNKLTRLTPWGRRSDSQPQQAVAQLWVLRMRMWQETTYRFQITAHHSSQLSPYWSVRQWWLMSTLQKRKPALREEKVIMEKVTEIWHGSWTCCCCGVFS